MVIGLSGKLYDIINQRLHVTDSEILRNETLVKVLTCEIGNGYLTLRIKFKVGFLILTFHDHLCLVITYVKYPAAF